MSPVELKSKLQTLVDHDLDLSVMIWGAPGLGKSTVVKQIAEDNQLEFTDIRISQLAPSDLRGLPVPENGESKWYPPEFLPRSGKGILFLDEINMSPPAVQAIAQQLILDRKIGNYSVPEGWFVWAAGNRKEDRASVFEMPAPLANRFLHFDVSPDLDSFRSWAFSVDLHEQIMAFLAFRPELLHAVDKNAPAWPSPRSWAMANELIQAGLEASPAIGEPAFAEFSAFIEVYEKIPKLDSILKGDSQAKFPKEPSTQFAITVGLGMRAKNTEEITHAFQWLKRNSGSEWCQLFIANAVDMAKAEGRLGELALLVQNVPEVQKFLKECQELFRWKEAA